MASTAGRGRRNPVDQLIANEVEPIVPEPHWQRVQAALVERRANRLPPERRKGAQVLNELLPCACGSSMAETCSSRQSGERDHAATGLVEQTPLETRVAWVRDLPERIDVEGAEQRGRLLEGADRPGC